MNKNRHIIGELQEFFANNDASKAINSISNIMNSISTGSGKNNGGILVFCDLDTIIGTCSKAYKYFEEKGYKKFYCGHFYGENFMTLDRIKYVESFARKVKAGKYEIKPVNNFMNLNSSAADQGFRMRFIR